MRQDIDQLVEELEDAAAQLRSGELAPEDAARTVSRCAELAARLGAQLDELAREPDETLPGQEELL